MAEANQQSAEEIAALLNAIVESLPFRVYALDADRRCILQNSVSQHDLGNLLGRVPIDLKYLPQEAAERWHADVGRALAGEVVWDETQFALPGGVRHYRFVMAPLRDGDAIRGVVGADIDITDQRQAELAAREREAERIEASRKLRQHEAELAHADRQSAMGQMASEIAHELNQPLYAIANFADACLTLLGRQPAMPDASLQRWLEQIAQQARRAGDVLRRVTQFVRKGELHVAPLDLNEIIRDVAELLDFEISQQAIDLRFELTEPLLPVIADRLLIEQVLVNLVRNAVEALATQETTPRQLVLRSRVENGGVRVEVVDSGPGLSEAQLARAFEPYFTTKASGTGMGLPICRSMIEAHRGRIWANNNPLGGAAFGFLLPADGAAAIEPA